MDVEKLRQLRRALPWKPYVLVMEDGRRLVIDQPPYMGISPNGRLVMVATDANRIERLKPESIKDAVLLDEMDGPAATAPSRSREPE